MTDHEVSKQKRHIEGALKRLEKVKSLNTNRKEINLAFSIIHD